MMMLFELFYSETFLSSQADPQSSDRRWDALTIELLGLRWLNEPFALVVYMNSYTTRAHGRYNC